MLAHDLRKLQNVIVDFVFFSESKKKKVFFFLLEEASIKSTLLFTTNFCPKSKVYLVMIRYKAMVVASTDQWSQFIMKCKLNQVLPVNDFIKHSYMLWLLYYFTCHKNIKWLLSIKLSIKTKGLGIKHLTKIPFNPTYLKNM